MANKTTLGVIVGNRFLPGSPGERGATNDPEGS